MLSLIFAIGLQSVCFEMIPLRGLYGEAIFRRNRLLWFVLFVGLVFLFVQTQLNPNGSFVGAFNRPNMIGLAVFVLGFCAGSALIWFYFRQKDKARERAE